MKEVIRDPAVLERMQTTFELYELAETMKRQNLRRRYPEVGEAEIEEKVIAWLEKRSETDRGDADGAHFVRREFRG